MVWLRCVQATCLLGVDRNRFSITAECRESFRAALCRTRVSPADDLAGGVASGVNAWGVNDCSRVVSPATEGAAVAATGRHWMQLFPISPCFACNFANELLLTGIHLLGNLVACSGQHSFAFCSEHPSSTSPVRVHHGVTLALRCK